MERRHPPGSRRPWTASHEPERDLSPRALGAMADAVRRSQEAVSGKVPADTHRPPTAAPRTPGSAGASNPARPPRHRPLQTAVAVTAAVVVLAALALAVSLVTGASSGSRPRSGEPAPTQPHRAPPAPHPSTPSSSQPSTSLPADTVPPPSTAPPPVAAGTAPTLSALTPSGGSAGQSIVISGTNFMSADGRIVARFGAQTAPTSCPVQTSCTVTVPPGAGSPAAVPVTITTDSGVSNTLTFTYG